MAVTMESAISMGKNFQHNRNSIANTSDLTLKQMFDISAKLVSEQEEISRLETIGWEKHNARKSTSFRILYCVLGGSIKIRNLTKHGRKEQDGSHLLKATETLTESMESRRNSSGTSSQDLIRCSSATKSKVY